MNAARRVSARHFLAARPRRGAAAGGGLGRIVVGVLGSLVGVVALLSAALGFLLYRHAHPPRVPVSDTPGTVFARYEDVHFAASDRVPLEGWWIPAASGGPVVILCHDLGESRASLLGLASILSGVGYGVFLFDFRGHGESGGTSSFGTLEKRDLLGAIDHVRSRESGADGTQVGVFGVGMGAHAAVLAAGERHEVVALVLDSPYRNAGASFAESRLGGGTAARWLEPAAAFLYGVFYGLRPEEDCAERRLAGLADRDLLFLAPRGNAVVAADVRRLYDALPETRQHDKNLILLAATRTAPLYAEDRMRYDEAVLSFFRSYLPAARAGSTPASSRSALAR